MNRFVAATSSLEFAGHLFSRHCLVAFAVCVGMSTLAGGAEVELVDFELDVRPILNQHCLACHGGVKQAADLSFIHRDAAMAVIEAGKPDESTLIDRITTDDEDEVMPPPEHGAPLRGEQIETLKKWIAQGANWNLPWAYQKPVAPSLPDVSKPDWCQQPLDRFILAKLDQESIQPAQEASPQQWLRRVTLDLTGLPPTPQEHDDFLADVAGNGEAAYEQVVDRLLKSPSYGERWASVWLDQIRYADSRGLGLDGRREIWKYRDWVIDALNDDMRFDEFTIKQLAGDLLPEPDDQRPGCHGCQSADSNMRRGGDGRRRVSHRRGARSRQHCLANMAGHHIWLCAMPQPSLRSAATR